MLLIFEIDPSTKQVKTGTRPDSDISYYQENWPLCRSFTFEHEGSPSFPFGIAYLDSKPESPECFSFADSLPIFQGNCVGILHIPEQISEIKGAQEALIEKVKSNIAFGHLSWETCVRKADEVATRYGFPITHDYPYIKVHKYVIEFKGGILIDHEAQMPVNNLKELLGCIICCAADLLTAPFLEPLQ